MTKIKILLGDESMSESMNVSATSRGSLHDREHQEGDLSMGKDLPRERKGIELPNNSIVGTTINVKIKQQSRAAARYITLTRATLLSRTNN